MSNNVSIPSFTYKQKNDYIEKSYKKTLLDLVADGIKPIIADVVYYPINVVLLKKVINYQLDGI